MKNEPVIVERVLNAPAAKVWKALTNKNEMKQWYFDLAEFKAEVGFEFDFTVEHEGFTYVHLCKVKEVIPGKKLSYSWRYKGHEGYSLVTIELFAEGNKTKLRLTHTGLETFPKLKAFARENFLQGWTDIIGNKLPKYVEA